MSGLQLLGNGHRAYLPAQMRFARPDALSPFGTGGINSYIYVAGDPVNKYDPTGGSPVAVLLLGLLAISGTAGGAAVASPARDGSPDWGTIGAVLGAVLPLAVATGVGWHAWQARQRGGQGLRRPAMPARNAQTGAVAAAPRGAVPAPPASARAAAAQPPAVGVVRHQDLPAIARDTIRRVRTGRRTHYPNHDGKEFRNHEGLLPGMPRGFYREYTVQKPNRPTRGPRRIVTGGYLPVTYRWYYSHDHYTSFSEVIF